MFSTVNDQFQFLFVSNILRKWISSDNCWFNLLRSRGLHFHDGLNLSLHLSYHEGHKIVIFFTRSLLSNTEKSINIPCMSIQNNVQNLRNIEIVSELEKYWPIFACEPVCFANSVHNLSKSEVINIKFVKFSIEHYFKSRFKFNEQIFIDRRKITHELVFNFELSMFYLLVDFKNATFFYNFMNKTRRFDFSPFPTIRDKWLHCYSQVPIGAGVMPPKAWGYDRTEAYLRRAFLDAKYKFII